MIIIQTLYHIKIMRQKQQDNVKYWMKSSQHCPIPTWGESYEVEAHAKNRSVGYVGGAPVVGKRVLIRRGAVSNRAHLNGQYIFTQIFFRKRLCLVIICLWIIKSFMILKIVYMILKCIPDCTGQNQRGGSWRKNCCWNNIRSWCHSSIGSRFCN